MIVQPINQLPDFDKKQNLYYACNNSRRCTMTTYRIPDNDIDILQSIIDYLTPLDLQDQHTQIEER